MTHTVIGTAGHIDHGKTQLVRALTGIDTDRTRQERERGITIELGFAHFDQNTTIIDVPGHERFVKTMVAGVSTIDLALLVIAADDGVMPQTREHLDVLQLLGIERGIVALNKIDLVDEEWLELVSEDIRSVLKGTFLESSPILHVSALQNQGIEELSKCMRSMLSEAAAKDRDARPFRLPVDRAFSVHGFGVVATGTAISGELHNGDELEQLPAGRRLRVRGLQSHGEDVGTVAAGARVAINLAGADAEQIERGDVLVAPGSGRATSMLDVDLTLLHSAPKALEQRTRVRVHIGTVEALGRVVLLREATLAAGERTVAQIRLEKPVAAAHGDRFVVRRYSPAVTIGGGVVLDPDPDKHREGASDAADALADLCDVSLDAAADAWVGLRGRRVPKIEDAAAAFAVAPERLVFALDESATELTTNNRSDKVTVFSHRGHRHLVAKQLWEDEQARIIDVLRQYHRVAPQEVGLPRASLTRELSLRQEDVLLEAVLVHLEGEGEVARQGAALRLATHEITLRAQDEELVVRLEQEMERAGLSQPPDAEALAKSTGAELAHVNQLLRALGRLDRIVFIDETLFIVRSQMDAARAHLEEHLTAAEHVSVSEYRQSLNTNRRYALALLNYFDAHGVTIKGEDGRRTRAV